MQDNFEAGVITNANDEPNSSLTKLDPKIGEVLSSKFFFQHYIDLVLIEGC